MNQSAIVLRSREYLKHDFMLLLGGVAYNSGFKLTESQQFGFFSSSSLSLVLNLDISSF